MPIESARNIADIAVKYPLWVVLLLLGLGAFWIAWRELQRRWEHERKVETERLQIDATLTTEWLKASCGATKKGDTEALVRIADALCALRQTGERSVVSGEGPTDGPRGGAPGATAGPDARVDSVGSHGPLGDSVPAVTRKRSE